MIDLISSKLSGEDVNSNHCLVLVYSYMSELLEDDFVIDEDYFKTYVKFLDNITDYVFTFLAGFINSIYIGNVDEKRINKSVKTTFN